MSIARLPVIDLGPFVEDRNSAAADSCVSQLREACHREGFCYLVGHGVPANLDHAVLAQAQEFFSLSPATKAALAIVNSPHFRGYTQLGGETTKGVSDWREQLDVGPEDPALELDPSDPPWRRLRGPNQWPASLPGLRTAVLEWMDAMDRLGLAVLRALAVGLGQRVDYFDSAFLPRGDPHLKIMRYPGSPAAADDGSASPDGRGGQGVGMHHDSGLVSFVLQDGVGGLEVDIDGTIVEASPLPGSYVMNLGEMLQAATNGYFRATPHRVRSPASGTERLSVAYFFHPRLDARFAPLDLPPALARQTRGGQNADPDDPVLETFGDNYLKIRLRSHRDVAEAHYADLF